MVSFNSAKRNKLLRQNYLDSLDLGNYAKYISKLKYSPTDKPGNIREFIAMEANILGGQLAAQGLEGIPSDIIVYPSAFRWFVGTTEGNFMSTIEHELRHAQQTFEAPEDYFPQLRILLSDEITEEEMEKYTKRVIALSEIDAYRFQLQRIYAEHVQVTEDMRLNLISNLEDYCNDLK